MNNEKFEQILKLCQECTDATQITRAAKHVAEDGNPYYICDFAENIAMADTPENMKMLEDAMIKTGDIVHVYEFMFLMVDSQIKNFDLNKFETIIKESKNPKLMCYCIGFVPGINKEEMLDALYTSKNAKYIERLSDEEYDIDLETMPEYETKLQEAKEYDYFPDCLNQFETRDINQLQTKVIESEDPYLINELADYMEYRKEYKGQEGIDIEPLQNAQLKYADPLHLYEFAASVMSSDKQAFQDKVIESDMPKYMYYVYEYVAGANKEELKEAVEKAGNDKYIEKVISSEMSENTNEENIDDTELF